METEVQDTRCASYCPNVRTKWCRFNCKITFFSSVSCRSLLQSHSHGEPSGRIAKGDNVKERTKLWKCCTETLEMCQKPISGRCKSCSIVDWGVQQMRKTWWRWQVWLACHRHCLAGGAALPLQTSALSADSAADFENSMAVSGNFAAGLPNPCADSPGNTLFPFQFPMPPTLAAHVFLPLPHISHTPAGGRLRISTGRPP